MTQPVLSTPFDLPPPRRRLPVAPEPSEDLRLFLGVLTVAGAVTALLVVLSFH